MSFITDDEWRSTKGSDGRIMKWAEIPQKQIFCVRSLERKENAKYETYIINFVDSKDEQFSAFCPAHFLRHIRKTRSKTQRPFFSAYGLVKRGEHEQAHFEIKYMDELKPFDIFE